MSNPTTTMPLRIALSGASGTGKTTLATFLADHLEIPFNPVGSRSVAKSMGFDNPYDVDKAGKRSEFQRRLVTEKVAWEDEHEQFVTDRTTLDNLVYTVFHDISAIDASLFDIVTHGMRRYTHVIYFPTDVFCDVAGDSNRVADMTYHRLFDVAIEAFLRKYVALSTKFGCLDVEGKENRKSWLMGFLDYL